MPNEESNRCIDVTDLYDAYCVQFKKWARWHFSQYDSLVHEDVFHDALIIYWENCSKGKFQNLYVPLINLLIGIGHNLFRKKGSKQALTFLEQMPESDMETVKNMLDTLMEEETEVAQTTWLNAGFNQLGEECRQLLSLFYYQQKKIPSIVALMGYKNDNVASATKSRCLKTLKTILENHDTTK
jgi:DNA-directed RNA polymerase specialized sigma24 family protein